MRLFVPVRNVGPSFTVFDPVYGSRLKPSTSIVRSAPEFRMTITTNGRGFRGPELVPGARGGVLFLGDSFTMGYGVNDGEEFPALVRRALEEKAPGRWPVVNAGVGGTGNGHWVKFLGREAPDLAPRVVVLQLCSNDFEDNLSERLFTLDPDGGLEELTLSAPRLRRVQALVDGVGLSSLHTVSLLRQVLSSPRGAATQGAPDALAAEAARGRSRPLAWALVRRAIEECRKIDATPLLFDVGLDPQDVEELGALARACGDVAVLRFPAKTERRELYFEVDGHWIPEGHALAARMVLERLLGADGRPGLLLE